MKRIVVCVPLSWSFVPTLFFHSWNQMMYYSQGKYELLLLSSSSCYMDTMRNNLVDAARRHKPDYILWLDADQLYPANTPEVLMAHINSGKSVVGGLTPRSVDGDVNVYELVHSEGIISPLLNVVPGRGLIKVGAMGMGGVMVDPEVFDKLDLPCFTMRWNSQLARYPGEDIQFYANCKKKGIDVWCDTNLVFGHIVTRALTIETDKK
jgi:hypothetical protein